MTKPIAARAADDSAAQLHVVLGAGQIGSRLTGLLLSRGHRVRAVQQSAPAAAPAHPRLQRARGDLTDLRFAEEATRGARVVYDCTNPPYHQWPRLLLALGRGGVHGASKAGAKLVALDCLYALGKPTAPMREDTPHAPCSKKGELRVALEKLRLDAFRRGDLPVAIGRASDFFGPSLQYSCWNDRFFSRLLAGKPGECMGDPELPHAYTFADDIAAALATLGAAGTSAEAPAAITAPAAATATAASASDGTGLWHLPTALAESTRALTERLGSALAVALATRGSSLPRPARVERLPRWLLATAGLFSPFLREVAEMTYQWEVPFLVDDSRFVATFGQAATPLADSAAVTAAWAAERFGAAGARAA